MSNVDVKYVRKRFKCYFMLSLYGISMSLSLLSSHEKTTDYNENQIVFISFLGNTLTITYTIM